MLCTLATSPAADCDRGRAGAPPVDLKEVNEAIHTEGQRIGDEAIARVDRAGVQTEAHCVGGHAWRGVGASRCRRFRRLGGGGR